MANLNGKKLYYWGLHIATLEDAKSGSRTSINVIIKYTFWHKVIHMIAYLAGRFNIQFIGNNIRRNRIIAEYRAEESRLRCI